MVSEDNIGRTVEKHRAEVSGKVVLVVDDEATIRQLVRRMLIDVCIVLEAADGEAALEMAQKYQPDLILMDIMMPKKDGYSACSELKRHPLTESIPIVIFTGLGYELNKKLAEAVGASGYITKPFTSRELLDIIGKFLRSEAEASSTPL